MGPYLFEQYWSSTGIARFAKSEAKNRAMSAPQTGPPAARAKPPRQSVLVGISGQADGSGSETGNGGNKSLGWELWQGIKGEA